VLRSCLFQLQDHQVTPRIVHCDASGETGGRAESSTHMQRLRVFSIEDSCYSTQTLGRKVSKEPLRAGFDYRDPERQPKQCYCLRWVWKGGKNDGLGEKRMMRENLRTVLAYALPQDDINLQAAKWFLN
jgi:hypothetical protein